VKYTRSAVDDGVTNRQRHATEDPPRKFSYKSEIAFADNYADIQHNENWRRAIRENPVGLHRNRPPNSACKQLK
jgi:hypothetical protein